MLITIFILQINEVNYKTSLSGKILTKCLINNSKRLAIFWPFLFIISIITTLLFGEYKEQEIINKLKNLETTEELIRIIISALIFAPLLEEIFFRKIIYSVCKRYLGVLIGIICSSILFATVHQNIYSFAILFTLSIALCIIYERDGSIISPIIFHFLFNLIMIILTFLS